MAKKKVQGVETEGEEEVRDKIVTTNEMLKCAFIEGELLDKGRSLARKQKEIVQLDLEKKSVVKQYDQKIAQAEAEIGLLSGHITDGYEFRRVDCEVRYCFDIGMKLTTRLDTQEQIREEALTIEETQMELLEQPAEEGAAL